MRREIEKAHLDLESELTTSATRPSRSCWPRTRRRSPRRRSSSPTPTRSSPSRRAHRREPREAERSSRRSALEIAKVRDKADDEARERIAAAHDQARKLIADAEERTRALVADAEDRLSQIKIERDAVAATSRASAECSPRPSGGSDTKR